MKVDFDLSKDIKGFGFINNFPKMLLQLTE